MIAIEHLESTEEVAQAARCKIYNILADSWRYPDAEFVELVRGGTFLEGIEAVVADLPFLMAVSVDDLQGRSSQEMSSEDFGAEFIRVFDVGPGGPPCPLREGLYHGGRHSIMEELIRFYHHFGLSTTQGAERRLPDDLTTELEFMHYLTFKEIMAVQRGEDPAPYRRAERDFLERRLTKWLPLMRERLDAFIARDFDSVNKSVIRFYKGLVELTEGFARADLDYAAG